MMLIILKVTNTFQTTIPVVCCMVLIIFTVLICAKYSRIFISFYKIWLMVVTSLTLQERQHHLQDLCLKRRVMDKSQFGGWKKWWNTYFPVLAKVKYWFPNICNGTAATLKCLVVSQLFANRMFKLWANSTSGG